jgi:HK97 family phage prohead protease
MTIKTVRTRAMPSAASDLDTDSRTVSLSFSSETPVDMGYATETLSHAAGSMVIGERQKHMPLLLNHDMSDILGTVEKIAIGPDKKGRATVRFGKDARGDWAMRQVQDGILKNTSFMYQVLAAQPDPDDDDGYIVTKFAPFELSLVSVPADASVGVGRSFSQGTHMETEELSRSQRRALAAGETERQDGINAERARIAEINAIAERFGLPADVSRRMISDGTSIADARATVLEMRSTAGVKPVVNAASTDLSARAIGVTDRELRGYSLFKALRAMAMPKEGRFQQEAVFEMEVSAALAQRSSTEVKGFAVPPEVIDVLRGRQKRTPIFADSGSGTNLVENTLMADDYISYQYIQPRVLAAGATVMAGLIGNALVPKMTATDQVAWLAAEGNAYNATLPTFAQVTLTPHDVAAYVDLSRRLLLQSTPAAESLIRQDLSTVISVAIDAAAISGAGASGVPLGILNQTGIGSVAAGTNGASITYGIIGALTGQLASANALFGRLAWLTTGGLAAHMMSTAKFTYGSQTLWEPPVSKDPVPGEGSIMYSPSFISNNCPSAGTKGTGTALQTLLLGNFADLLVGQWGVLQILADPYSQSSTGTTRLTAIQTLDIQVRHAQSFAVCTDLLLT